MFLVNFSKVQQLSNDIFQKSEAILTKKGGQTLQQIHIEDFFNKNFFVAKVVLFGLFSETLPCG